MYFFVSEKKILTPRCRDLKFEIMQPLSIVSYESHLESYLTPWLQVENCNPAAAEWVHF